VTTPRLPLLRWPQVPIPGCGGYLPQDYEASARALLLRWLYRTINRGKCHASYSSRNGRTAAPR
jgi:hypothetical protein